MQISSVQVKQFLLELIDSNAYKGSSIEFVLAVKTEILSAEIEKQDTLHKND